jgi:hypothetical protein
MITLYVSEEDAIKLMNMRGVNVKIKEDVEVVNSKELICMGYTRQMLSYYRQTYPEIITGAKGAHRATDHESLTTTQRC